MVSSGYGVEGTVESIWNTAWETIRFDFINIELGTRFNFWITGDAATDITDSKVVKLLEVESNGMFAFWNAMAKIEKTVNPWDFIDIWMKEHMAGDQFYDFFKIMIEKCKNILNEGGIELVTRYLPSSTSDW